MIQIIDSISNGANDAQIKKEMKINNPELKYYEIEMALNKCKKEYYDKLKPLPIDVLKKEYVNKYIHMENELSLSDIEIDKKINTQLKILDSKMKIEGVLDQSNNNVNILINTNAPSIAEVLDV
jgi:hypothetical protein